MGKMNVGYLRVSTENQTEKYGLDVQRGAIEDYCKKNNITIDKWYVDGGYSGKKMQRPAMLELLSDCEKGIIDTVYTYKLDRMSRDTIDTLNLLYNTLPNYDVKIVSMSEQISTKTPMDKVFVTLNAAMNQYEREIIRTRMTAGLQERVKGGKWRGGGNIPYGYRYDRNDGLLHIYEPEAAVVRKVYDLYIDGNSCLSIPDLIGVKKTERAIILILKNTTYTGVVKYRGVEYPGNHEAIISKEKFDLVQRIMEKRSKKIKPVSDNLLTGLIYCGNCGARMRYQKWGKYYYKLICYSYQGCKKYLIKDPNCDNSGIRADTVESEVEDCFKRFAISSGSDDNDEKSKIETIRESLSSIGKKLKRLYVLYADSDSDALIETISELESQKKTLESELESETERSRKKSQNNYTHIAEIWDQLSTRDKNSILKMCIDKILIYRDNIEIHFITN